MTKILPFANLKPGSGQNTWSALPHEQSGASNHRKVKRGFKATVPTVEDGEPFFVCEGTCKLKLPLHMLSANYRRSPMYTRKQQRGCLFDDASRTVCRICSGESDVNKDQKVLNAKVIGTKVKAINDTAITLPVSLWSCIDAE